MCQGLDPTWREQSGKEKGSSDGWVQPLTSQQLSQPHQTYEQPPFPASLGGSSMLQVPAFTQRSTAAPPSFGFSCFSCTDPLPTPSRQENHPTFKKKKKVPLGAFPIPPPARAQPSANVSALQGTAERKIKQIPPRTRQAHTRRWHRAG